MAELITKELLTEVATAIIKAMKGEIHDVSGDLSNSLNSNVKEYSISVEMKYYGEFVNTWATHNNPNRSKTGKDGLKLSGPFIKQFTDTVALYKDEIEAAIGKEIGDNLYDLLVKTTK